MYEVSDAGRVRRLGGRVLRPCVDRGPRTYPRVTLCGKHRRVHRLVAVAFLGEPPEGKPQVNHLNGVKMDNRAENLEWCSLRQNVAHAVATGLQRVGEGLPYVKLSEDAVICAFILKRAGWKGREIGRHFGVGARCINAALRGETWGHFSGAADQPVTLADLRAAAARLLARVRGAK